MNQNWIYTTTIYQIYPRSFFDSNNDGIGDIQGIIKKLDYIKDLGFETIWISPFYTSPQVDFGYDIADYTNIAPEYGTLEDAQQLIDECHKRKLKIVFDMVMNHTSDQHPWFLESRKDKTNPKADWYIWRDKPNNWKSIVGPKAWKYAPERKQYFYSSFLNFQPDLNYRNEEVKKTMFDICRFWLAKGVDGFRLDIFNCIIKDKDFRDNPFSLIRAIPSHDYPGGNFQIRKYNVNQAGNFEFAKELRQVSDEFTPERMLLGEVFGLHSLKKQFLGKNNGLHLIFLFDICFYKFNASFFRKKFLEYEREYPAPLKPTLVFSNHDQFRSIRRVGNNPEKAKLVTLLQLTARAVPTSYYGEEIGMVNQKIPLKNAQDGMSKTFKWIPQIIVDALPVPINRDNCRTPMQWDKTKNAGFSTADTTWLPVHEDFETCNVETIQQDKNSIYYTYKNLLAIRKNSNSLQNGNLEIVDVNNDNILAYTRTKDTESLLILINFKHKKQTFSIPKNIEITEFIYGIKSKDFKQAELFGIDAVLLKCSIKQHQNK
ncbi:MAG TPA: alpha-glucosidase [Chitinophagales bacterium]|nr:alpha-glucosidase [Chitinophagales bacterium]MCB0512420.1 alpha-glucosidase [Bacteroidota bacterium]MCB9074766.1 alpha-glucosidase [Chitinophagales bacterium]HMU97214.1 alpha-glucosidase [Chitinophagales bacterium]HMV03300.1 alpha-glucosidase [Chitinophagales bacterium]